ncbi:MAG: hypothetical protein OQK98_11880 [Gammaproteobacteria bacterium]|nr:hypothetical protein [Gammaproteobacteria bacterium]
MRKLTLSLAVMAALLPVRGYPLGLGDLELNSALNQELNAEIAVLSAATEDAEQIIIKLADRDAFIRAGLDRPHLLQQLQFKMIDKNGSPYVKVYTKTPIREPFLSFLLEIDWPQGHLLREYTLLLDPPVYNTSGLSNNAPASTDVNSPFNEPTDAQAQTQPVFSEQQSASTVQSRGQAAPVMQAGVISSDAGRSVNYQYQPLPAATSSPDQYRVQQNDTLWSMANRMRPDNSVSVEQMMLAMVRKNPEAFIQENINGVKRGYILRIPGRDEATQIDRQQAVAQAREHAALWREYSQGAASASPASSMEADAFSGDSAADQRRDADGHLSIVGASESGSEQAGSNQDPDAQLSRLKQDLNLAREQLESEKLEKEDLRARLAELEQRVQRVIEMDDGELAKLQQDLQSSQQTVEVMDGATAEDAPVEDVATEEMPAEDMLETMPEEPSEAAMDEGVTDESSDAPTEEAIFADETADETVTGEVAEIEPQAQTIEPVEAIETPVFAQQKPKNFLDSLMEDPRLLGMIGGGLAFVFLLVALLLKRIRGSKAEEEDQWASAMDDPADLSNLDDNLDAAVDEATVKTEAVDMTSTAEMMAAPEAVSEFGDTQIEAPDVADDLEDTVFDLEGDEPASGETESDDVIAEADVYLAYGIYQQAEELLNSAIDENPERDDYRMKLLETHYAAKNSTGFARLAEDVKARKGDDKAYWDRVIAMGMELCPENALFSGSDVNLSDIDADALLPEKPQKADLELDAGDESSTDFDLGLDDADLGGLEDDSGETQVLSAPADPGMESAEDELDLAGDLDDIANELEKQDDTSSDLEFDLGEFDDMEISSETESSTEDLAESSEMDIDDDFSLDFDAADLGFEESESESGETDEISPDADLDLGEDLDETPEVALGDDLGEIEIEGEELDLGELDLDDMDLADTDLGDTDLNDSDLGDLSLDDAVTSTDMDLSDDDSEFDISELSEDVDEVSTKLDLAKAYIDMGDNDGARSILEEVKAEGNDEQQQQANELLQRAS